MSWAAKAKSRAPPPKRQTVIPPPQPPPTKAVCQLNEIMSSALQTKAAPPLPLHSANPPLPTKPPLPIPLNPPRMRAADEALARAKMDMEELVKQFDKKYGLVS